jgi:hypothetical protein
MTKVIIGILAMITLTGCVFVQDSAPKENLEFSQKADLQQFKGVYRNAGDPKGNLSQLIWKRAYIVDNSGRKIPHNEIELIEVLSSGNALTVNAIKGECVIYRQDYVVGSDFTLTDGRIVLKQSFHPLSREGEGGARGDVTTGPSYEKVELGLDAKGDGKYRSQAYFAGIVVIIPMAAWETADIRFVKLNSNVTYKLCTNREHRNPAGGIVSLH